MTHFQGFVVAFVALSIAERFHALTWWIAVPLLFGIGWDLARARDVANGKWHRALPRTSPDVTSEGKPTVPCECGGRFIKATYGGVCNRCGATV